MKKVFGLEEGKRSERKIVRECDLRMRYVKNLTSLPMRKALAALTVNCLPTLDLADRRAEAAAREANILML